MASLASWFDPFFPTAPLGYLHTYASGTTTPQQAWKDAAETLTHTLPTAGVPASGITLDAAGRVPTGLFLRGTYTIHVYTAAGVLVTQMNNVTGGADAASALDVALRADLASSTVAAKGAGQIGYRGPQGAPADSVAERLSWEVYVTDPQFGAVGDNATDSTAALAAAVTYVNSLCDIVSDSVAVTRFPRLIFPPSLGFRSTATLSIRAGVEVVMQSPLMMVAAAGTPIIGIDLIDAKGVDYQAPRGTSQVFDVRRVTQSNLASESDIGVRIPALYVGKPYFKRIDGFTVSFDACLGYGDVTIGDIRDCRKAYIRGRAGQFTNKIVVRGGSFSCGNGVGVGLSRYGIVVQGVAPFGANTILFDGQSFELAKTVAGAADAIPYLIDGTAAPVISLRAINQRNEGGQDTFARLTGEVRNCEFGLLDAELEYLHPTALLLDDQSSGAAAGGGNVAYRHHGASAPHWTEFFSTGRLAERALGITGSLMSIVNMEAATNVGAAPATQTLAISGAPATFDTSGNMTAAGPLFGVRVKMNGSRFVAVSGRKPTATAANVSLLLFDSAGVQITSATAVASEQAYAAVNTGVYGGLYTVGVHPVNDARFFDVVLQFASNVATAFICVTSAVEGWVLKRVDPRVEWFSATSHMREQFVATNTPVSLTNVTYKAGMCAVHGAPAVGQPKGWALDTGATWRSKGNL